MKVMNIREQLSMAVVIGMMLGLSSTTNADVIHRLELQYGSISKEYMQSDDWTTPTPLAIDEALPGLFYRAYIDDWSFKIGFEAMSDASIEVSNDNYYGAPFATKLLLEEEFQCLTETQYHCSTSLPERTVTQKYIDVAASYFFTETFSVQLEYQYISSSYEAHSETTHNTDNITANFNSDTSVTASLFTITPAYSWKLTDDLGAVLFFNLHRGPAKATTSYTGTVNSEARAGSLSKLSGSVIGASYGLKLNYFMSDSWLASLSYWTGEIDYNLSDSYSYVEDNTKIRYSISYVF